MKNKKSLQTMLGIGILGAVMGLVGDFLLGWMTYPAAATPETGMMAGCAALSYARMGLSICFGGIGIPLQYFAYRAVADMLRKGGHTKSARLVHVTGAVTAAMGGAVHILCVVLMMLVRAACDQGFDPLAAGTLLGSLPDSAMQFAVWGLLPFTVIFYLPYMIGLIAMFVAFVRRFTDLPRITCLFNPLIGIMLINTVTEMLPNTPLVNSIAMGNMGFASLAAFLGILVMMCVNRCE